MKNGKIGVGIVGVHPTRGWAMTAHVPALQASPDFELVALTNSNLEAAQEAGRQFGVRHVFQRHEDLLSCADVDLVVVTVRVPYHFDLVKAAIEAGKSVYCEWPLGNGLAEAVELERLATSHKVRAVVGLQSRASPEVNYLRDLIRDGYAGEILSVSLVGSGIIGGAVIPAAFAYTLDPKNGAGILNVAFAHAIDAASYALDSSMVDVVAVLGRRRKTARVAETNAVVEMLTPDQIAVSAKMANGAVMSAHFRGGMSRGTNFRLEINGTLGDLVVTSSLGYPGVGDTRIEGAGGTDTVLQALEVPQRYREDPGAVGMASNVAGNYARLAADIKAGTNTAPTFGDAVRLHRILDAIERSAGTGARQHV